MAFLRNTPLFTILFIAFLSSIESQAQTDFQVELNKIEIQDMPGLHSFSWAVNSAGEWLIIGGRKDGLHQRQPHSAFLSNDNNVNIYVVSPSSNQVFSSTISQLNENIREQLQSTNQEFIQRGNHLYIFGGYGYSESTRDHITYPYLSAIDVDGVTDAIKNSNSITKFIRQIKDDRFAVTGGQIGLIDSTLYLCGGQKFTGRYNPMGPDHGPGFKQEYTDQIRRFQLVDNGSELKVENYRAWTDKDLLHRRDYNMLPNLDAKIEGLIMFSGVFQPDQDIPWLNCVELNNQAYNEIPNFSQFLSQYHSAKLAMYNDQSGSMDYLFFGGMSQYFMDDKNNLIKDDDVPFVNTISSIHQTSTDSFIESKLNIEMPGLLGSGSEFIPLHDKDLYLDRDILNWNKIGETKTLIGHIIGGIESSEANIFFKNTGTQSNASAKVFEVYLRNGALSNYSSQLETKNILQLKVLENPIHEILKLNAFFPQSNVYQFEIIDLKGKSLQKTQRIFTSGLNEISIELKSIPAGIYYVQMSGSNYKMKQKFIKL